MGAAPHLIFVPVSGPKGTGELMRCLIIADAALTAWPDARIQFVVSRQAPASIGIPYERLEIDGSPTYNSPAICGFLREHRPSVVVFDNGGRTAQLRAARELGAGVIYVSRRPAKRLRTLRLGWLPRLDQHWIAYPPEIGGSVSGFEKLVLRLFGHVEIVILGAVFVESKPQRRGQLLERLGLAGKRYVLLAPGGGGRQIAGRDGPRIFRDAAEKIRTGSGLDVVLVSGMQADADADADAPADVTALPSLSHPHMIDLIHDAHLVVGNGGTTLMHCLAHAKVTVAVPLAGDQPRRILRASRLGAVVPAALDSDEIARATLALLGDSPRYDDVARKAAALGITNGVGRAVAGIGRLIGRDPAFPGRGT